jgi:hypothetical protein
MADIPITIPRGDTANFSRAVLKLRKSWEMYRILGVIQELKEHVGDVMVRWFNDEVQVLDKIQEL